jgi:hypothetical protein
MNRWRRVSETFGRFAVLLCFVGFVSHQAFAQTGQARKIAHPGALTGFAFVDAEGVVTLGRSPTPPDGARAAANATASVASATTKTDDVGAFTLTGIPAGLGTLHVATAKGPKGDFPVTIFGGATARLGAPSVTRAAALAVVVKALATITTDPEATIIIGPQEPLPAGTKVAPALGSDNGQPSAALIYTARSEQWLIYVDPELFLRYPHPVSFFFVDASTAALNKLDETSWPTINGLSYYGNHDTNVKSPDLMAGPTIPSGPKPAADNVGRPPLTAVLRNTLSENSRSTLEPSGRSVGGLILLTSLLSEPAAHSRSRLHDTPPIPQTQATTTGFTYFLNIQGANESDQVADHSNITQIFGQGGIPPIKDEKDSTPGDPAVPNTEGARNEDVEAKFQQLCTEAGPNDTLFVYITAHGQVARRDGVQLDSNAVNNNGDPVVFDSLASNRFNFSNCKAGHVIFLIDACYSGAFATGLNKSLSTTGLNYTIISSTDSTHESAYVPSWYHGGYSVLVPGGFLSSPPTGGVFTNTFISAFTSQLADNPGGIIDLKQVFTSTANRTGSWRLPGIAGIAEQHPFFLTGAGALAQVGATAGNGAPGNKTAPPQPAQPQVPIPPAPPLPPPLPPLTPGKPVPIAARLPLPKCWPSGTDVKAACKPWLDIAERNQLAADLAGEALANADSDLAQAARLDALAAQWDDHAKSLAKASADYEAMSQSDRQKAGSSSSTDSAVQWENFANQAEAQSKALSDQAAQAQAQADAIRGEAKALRDKVAAEKADEAAKKAAAAASWQDYNACLKVPQCMQPGQAVTTNPPSETTTPTSGTTPQTGPGGAIIPAPPIFHGTVPTATGADTGFGHQATQDPNDPTHAHDSTTGQNLYWDADKKTWVDSATGQSLGFDGSHTANGTIIPAPPIFHGTVPTATGADTGFGHQATQDPNDPTHAHDSTTGQNLYWDPDKKTWVDSKTGQSLGFDGVVGGPSFGGVPGGGSNAAGAAGAKDTNYEATLGGPIVKDKLWFWGSYGKDDGRLRRANVTNTGSTGIPANSDNQFEVMSRPAKATASGPSQAAPTGSSKNVSSNRSPTARFELAAYHVRAGAKDFQPSEPRNLLARDAWQDASPDEIRYSLVANGNSSGEAFELQVFDPSGRLTNVELPEGLVVEPLQPGSAKPVAETAKGAKLLTKTLTAYCANYAKLPPKPGMLYRIAPQSVQDQFAPMRYVLQAGREAEAAGKFHPDSDAAAYNDSIRQYALWTKKENWDEQKFGEVFLEKTKENALTAKVQWTPELEQAVRALIPGRWRDISIVLEDAKRLSATSASGPGNSKPPETAPTSFQDPAMIASQQEMADTPRHGGAH